MAKLLLFNKPYGVLSQFTAADGHPGLAEHIQIADIYPAGRLDRDSEGLLLLTDNGALQAQISHPRFKLEKTYLAQVEGEITDQALQRLRDGITLKDGPTRPAYAQKISPPTLWNRNPPIRQRQNQPTSWLELRITEGRNRQVRRMAAHVGFPVLRLIRTRVGRWHIGDLQSGEQQLCILHMPDSISKPTTKPKSASKSAPRNKRKKPLMQQHRTRRKPSSGKKPANNR